MHCCVCACVVVNQVVIGAHGRLKNWVMNRMLDIDNIVILVFDEADEMLKADSFLDDTGAVGRRPLF